MNFRIIQEARKAQKISRRELGEKINRSIHTIKKYELGENTPPDHIAHKIEIALDLPIGTLKGNASHELLCTMKRLQNELSALPEDLAPASIQLLESMIEFIRKAKTR
ncbi:hypothetical protein A8139_05620 [Marinomonas primoryensis]|uniref:HTH cro/C1-type domain-containing protein n=1 Tax=Marinomonas primoryensis TaxID=178399 RepID=A0A2Z4PPZ2_9GAMM|nr:helix-turn-helix transcriptional regulator [Marinomonas primoryensis]AWX99529.1 hypothetical protein A8139_05620 [Marinomonas primoryensis]